MIEFDPTISLGNLVTFVGFIIGGVGAIYALRGEVKSLNQRMGGVENELKKMSDVLVELGRQDERLSAINRRLDDLQHGRGFVLDGLPRSMRSPTT